MTANIQSAGHRVAHTVELLEMILLKTSHIDAPPSLRFRCKRTEAVKDLLRSQLVSRIFRDTIKSSSKLKEALFQVAPKEFFPRAEDGFNMLLHWFYVPRRLPCFEWVAQIGRADGYVEVQILSACPSPNAYSGLEVQLSASWRPMYLLSTQYKVVRIRHGNIWNKELDLTNPTAGELYDLMFGPVKTQSLLEGSSGIKDRL